MELQANPEGGSKKFEYSPCIDGTALVLFNTTFANHVVEGKLGRSSMSLSERLEN